MPAQLSAILTEAIRQAEDRVYREIDTTLARLPDDGRLLDDLERAIDDSNEAPLQAELRRLLGQFDANSEAVRSALSTISVYDSFDPVRTIATDAASGFL